MAKRFYEKSHFEASVFEKIINWFRSELNDFRKSLEYWMNAWEERNTVPEPWTLSSGCRVIDEVVGGGFKSQNIYEIFGPKGVGKNFLIHQLICQYFLGKNGKDGGRVMYFNLDHNFNIKWMHNMCNHYGMNVHGVMENILTIDQTYTKNINRFLPDIFITIRLDLRQE